MTTQKKKIYGLILAGGFSKRMGQDKALLNFHGVVQIEYVFDLLSRHCDQVFLSKRADQSAYPSIAAINDVPTFSNSGPLGGILSAMQAHPDAAWLVMACDLPFVNDETIKALIAARAPAKFATAFISTHDGLPEPLCSIWEPQSYPIALKSLEEGIRCPRKMLIKNDTQLLIQENLQWLDNINTPQEYAITKARLSQLA